MLVRDILGTQAELCLEALQVLRQREPAEQVDLTVREARLDPLLQQLQHVLEDGEQEKHTNSSLPQKRQLWEKKELKAVMGKKKKN